MRIGVIGCGNMAQAVVKGIYKHNKYVHFMTYTPTRKRAVELALEVQGEVVANLSEMKNIDYLFICCKPQQFDSLAKDLKDIDLSHVTIVSIMAAISVESIQEKLNANQVIRLIPSIPMAFDKGISLVFHSSDINKGIKTQFDNLLKGSSLVHEVRTEDEMEKLTIITSSGPAFVFYFMEAFEKIIKDWNLELSESKELISKLFEGAAQTYLQSHLSSEKLISNVTSKGGVTIETIKQLKENDVQESIFTGVNRSLLRSKEISNEFATN